MSLSDLLFGRRLGSRDEIQQRVGPLSGIPMLGLDALSSAAYGPEAAMTLLIPLGALGIGAVGPIIAVIYLVGAYHIAATEPGVAGYQSVLAQLVAAVAGRGLLYYLSIGAILSVLALSANTGFADFPRLCRQMAHDGYLPKWFASRGRRLVYSNGIFVLTGLSAFLLVVFGGITDRLIPLFVIGAFLAFTLSQAGMVGHWLRVGGPHQARNVVINGLGASATGVTLVVVLVARISEGSLVTALVIPLLLAALVAVKGRTSR